mmetsp:Transcript_100223/g.269183  ORF Transcript_100223/g.269183 Transcript_100223/m.269183 type:complete len:249 (-) Transcript_100223:435-1181(-)
MRVIASVLGFAMHARPPTKLVSFSSLALVNHVCLGPANPADRAPAILLEQADLGTLELHSDSLVVFGQHGRCCACCTLQRPTLSRLHLNVVNLRADGHRAQRHGIADKDRRLLVRDDLLADEVAQAVQDVALLTVFVLDQADARVSERVILDGLDGSEDATLCAAEVDDAVPSGMTRETETKAGRMVPRTAGPSCGHLDMTTFGPRVPPPELEHQGLVPPPLRTLLEGCDAGISQMIPERRSVADARG